MGTTTYISVLAVGAVIAILSGASLIRRPDVRRSLTAWILLAMGIGIAVGAIFRYHATEVFDPRPPEIQSSERGPWRFEETDEGAPAITVRAREGASQTLTIPTGRSLEAPELARALQEQDPVGFRPVARAGRLVLIGQDQGEGARLAVVGGSLNATRRLGLEGATATGSGDPQSLIKRIHEFLRSLFLNALRMMIVPVIFFSIISGMLSLGSRGSIGRIGLKTLGYYVMTSFLAIVVGLMLVNLIRPGRNADIVLEDKPQGFEETASQSPSEFLFDFFLGLIPENPVAAMVEGDILQVIFFALLVGFFVTRLGERHRTVLSDAFEGLFQTMMKVVRFLLWLAPIGVYAIFVMVIAETGPSAFADLGLYALAVVVGLMIHAMITLPSLLLFLGRLSPWKHFRAMNPALLTAFSTSSSAATLPVTIRCAETRVGISNRTSSFVLPLGATVNMDGTALYECVAAVFIAQIYVSQGVIDPLTVGQQFLVVFTALAASIGAAGVPMAGMVMLGIILRALGLPLEGVGYVLAVDRLLDMCRTTVNIWSDSVGCALIAKSEGETDLLRDPTGSAVSQ